MAENERLICPAADLENGGPGVRFEVSGERGPQAAFVVRFEGRVCGFLNRCAHVPVELDWQLGQFFDEEGRYLICATHGAVYEPGSGRCVAGPCAGQSLVTLEMVERDGAVWLKDGKS